MPSISEELTVLEKELDQLLALEFPDESLRRKRGIELNAKIQRVNDQLTKAQAQGVDISADRNRLIALVNRMLSEIFGH